MCDRIFNYDFITVQIYRFILEWKNAFEKSISIWRSIVAPFLTRIGPRFLLRPLLICLFVYFIL